MLCCGLLQSTTLLCVSWKSSRSSRDLNFSEDLNSSGSSGVRTISSFPSDVPQETAERYSLIFLFRGQRLLWIYLRLRSFRVLGFRLFHFTSHLPSDYEMKSPCLESFSIKIPLGRYIEASNGLWPWYAAYLRRFVDGDSFVFVFSSILQLIGCYVSKFRCI